MRAEIIVSTYNAPRYLWLSLLSVTGQTRLPDSICVADDGSGPETAAVLGRFRDAFPALPLRHVWQADDGFRKTAILNRAVASSEADLLIFTDGDCLLSPGFAARHLAVAREDRFASGSLIRLGADASAEVADADVREGTVFRRDWLDARGGFDRMTTRLKAMPFGMRAQAVLDRVYPIRRTFMGANASVFREAVLAVNGFDETMAWGGEDKEFGIRLANSGVSGFQMRFTTPVVHLDHARSYRDPAAIKRQRRMIKEARRDIKTWTGNGIA